jgi:hypothetical protein
MIATRLRNPSERPIRLFFVLRLPGSRKTQQSCSKICIVKLRFRKLKKGVTKKNLYRKYNAYFRVRLRDSMHGHHVPVVLHCSSLTYSIQPSVRVKKAVQYKSAEKVEMKFIKGQKIEN